MMKRRVIVDKKTTTQKMSSKYSEKKVWKYCKVQWTTATVAYTQVKRRKMCHILRQAWPVTDSHQCLSKESNDHVRKSEKSLHCGILTSAKDPSNLGILKRFECEAVRASCDQLCKFCSRELCKEVHDDDDHLPFLQPISQEGIRNIRCVQRYNDEG